MESGVIKDARKKLACYLQTLQILGLLLFLSVIYFHLSSRTVLFSSQILFFETSEA